VSAPADAGRDDSLRLFFGLPLPPEIAAALAAWGTRTLAGRPTVRVLDPDHLHVTLAFLGRRPSEELPALRGALHDAADGQEQPVLAVDRYRETRSVAMLVLSDAGGRAGRLQERLVGLLEEAGAHEREHRPWLAHVTVARLRERARLRPELPDIAAFSPSEAALYRSLLGRGGARYEILETALLGAAGGR
jgi:2'-5' RNA ligase